MATSEHFDDLEQRDPRARDKDELAALAAQIARAKAEAPALKQIWA